MGTTRKTSQGRTPSRPSAPRRSRARLSRPGLAGGASSRCVMECHVLSWSGARIGHGAASPWFRSRPSPGRPCSAREASRTLSSVMPGLVPGMTKEGAAHPASHAPSVACEGGLGGRLSRPGLAGGDPPRSVMECHVLSCSGVSFVPLPPARGRRCFARLFRAPDCARGGGRTSPARFGRVFGSGRRGPGSLGSQNHSSILSSRSSPKRNEK